MGNKGPEMGDCGELCVQSVQALVKIRWDYASQALTSENKTKVIIKNVFFQIKYNLTLRY